MGDERDAGGGANHPSACCPLYHQAIELIGKRWTGAIVSVLLDRPLRFSEISQAVPQLSDRLLSERMKELEARGVVERTVVPGPPVRVEYGLTAMGRDLSATLSELKQWAHRWLGETDGDEPAAAERSTPAAII